MTKNLLLITLFSFCTISAFTQLRFGAGASSDLDRVGVQGKVLLDLENLINKPLDGSATVSYFFKNKSQTFLTVDLDAHYSFIDIGDNIVIDAISGVHLARISTDFANNTESKNGIGLNAGAHITLFIEEFIIYLQPKAVISGGLTGFVVSAGFMF